MGFFNEFKGFLRGDGEQDLKLRRALGKKLGPKRSGFLKFGLYKSGEGGLI